MTVRVNHARHENAASRVDLRRAIRHSELPRDFSDAVVNDEDIAALDHAKRGVNGQHSGVTKYHRAFCGEGIAVYWCVLTHVAHLVVSWPQDAKQVAHCLLDAGGVGSAGRVVPSAASW